MPLWSMENMEHSLINSCQVRDLRISVVDSSMHSIDFNDAAFKYTQLMAFKLGFMDEEETTQKIKDEVPLEELDNYATHLKSITQGSTSHSREFLHYAPVPTTRRNKW